MFLVQYSRQAGQMVEPLRQFADVGEAFDARLAAELHHHRSGVDVEVVLLDAPSEHALRESHGRYFLTVQQLIDRMAKGLQ
jgi:hypothetical protein